MPITVISRKSRDQGRKMSVRERETLQERKETLETQLKTVDPRNADPRQSFTLSAAVQDRGQLQDQVEKAREILDRDESLEAKGKEKDRLRVKAQEQAEFLGKTVPPLWLQKSKPGSPDYVKAVEAAERANRPDVARAYESYQDCQRRLDPENPSAGSIREVISK